MTHAMALLRGEKASIGERLPQLGRSKKTAVEARNFKEAGALSKEIKGLETRRSEVEAEMDGLMPRLAQLEDAQQAADAAKQSAQQKLDDASDGLDAVRLEGLRARAAHLATDTVVIVFADAAATLEVAEAPHGTSPTTPLRAPRPPI